RPPLYLGTGNNTSTVASGDPYSAGSAFVGLLHTSLQTATNTDSGGNILATPTAAFDVERVNYDSAVNGRLNVFGLGGNDYYAADDNATTTTLDGGAGDDSFQIGQLYGLRRTSSGSMSGNLAAENVFDVATVATTRGWLSRGTSSPLVAEGGTGNDTFTVYSNHAPVRLEGDDGNDLFVVRGFALAQTCSDVSVTVRNIQVIEVDALEGDDTIGVLSTPPGVAVRVIGGLGSDQINVAGDVNGNVYSRDIEGTSAVINHGIVSNDPAYNNLVVNGVSLSVA